MVPLGSLKIFIEKHFRLSNCSENWALESQKYFSSFNKYFLSVLYVVGSIVAARVIAKLTLEKEITLLQHKPCGLYTCNDCDSHGKEKYSNTIISKWNIACLGVHPLENRWLFIESKIWLWCLHAKILYRLIIRIRLVVAVLECKALNQ